MRTIARRKKEKKLRPDESDRLVRVARIGAIAEGVLGSEQKAAAWLRESNRALGGIAPLEILDTDIGIKQVEEILGRIEYGVYSGCWPGALFRNAGRILPMMAKVPEDLAVDGIHPAGVLFILLQLCHLRRLSTSSMSAFKRNLTILFPSQLKFRRSSRWNGSPNPGSEKLAYVSRIARAASDR